MKFSSPFVEGIHEVFGILNYDRRRTKFIRRARTFISYLNTPSLSFRNAPLLSNALPATYVSTLRYLSV